MYWQRILIKTATKTSDKLQRIACLCITEAKRTTGTMVMEAILTLIPLQLLTQQKTLCTADDGRLTPEEGIVVLEK